MLAGSGHDQPSEVFSTRVVNVRGRTIRAQTSGQKHYVEAIANHTIVFGIGPAGTGKTYLAMAMAVNALRSKKSTASFSPAPPLKQARISLPPRYPQRQNRSLPASTLRRPAGHDGT
ncbi:MAG: PhoH family protein [Lawsonella clevelandensis]